MSFFRLWFFWVPAYIFIYRQEISIEKVDQIIFNIYDGSRMSDEGEPCKLFKKEPRLLLLDIYKRSAEYRKDSNRRNEGGDGKNVSSKCVWVCVRWVGCENAYQENQHLVLKFGCQIRKCICAEDGQLHIYQRKLGV